MQYVDVIEDAEAVAAAHVQLIAAWDQLRQAAFSNININLQYKPISSKEHELHTNNIITKQRT